MRLMNMGAAALWVAMGCGDGAVTFDDATSGGGGGASSSSTASGGAAESSSTAGAGGRGGTTADGGAGGQGGVGGAPVECPEPICGSPSNSILCGCNVNNYHPACEGLCDYPTFTDPLPMGVTFVRLDPIAEINPACAAICSNSPDIPAASLTLRLPSDAHCVTVDGPESLLWRIGTLFVGPAPMCDKGDPNTFSQCGTAEIDATGSQRWLMLSIASDAPVLPNNGARVRIEVGAPGMCAAPACAGGCSG